MKGSLEGLIDTHFHLLEMEKRGIDPSLLLQDLQNQGLAGGMDIGIEYTDITRRAPLLIPYPTIRIAAGIGPWAARTDEPIDELVYRFTKTIVGYRVDCIGEIGLDFHWNYGTPAKQEELFERQIILANELLLPVAIHSRDADRQTAALLTQIERGVLHCFSSSWPLAEIALEQGLYISFAGSITFEKNHALREVVKRVPLERLLLETDSPYLSPIPYRGKTNTPHRMVEIYQQAALIKGIGLDELVRQVKTNFFSLFPPHKSCVPRAE